MTPPNVSRESRLFCVLVVCGAALTAACSTRDAETIGPVSPQPAGDTDASEAGAAPAEDTESSTGMADTQEASCECTGEGWGCQANGVSCCWANDPCCESCCPDLS